jgi:hypothetical protein
MRFAGVVFTVLLQAQNIQPKHHHLFYKEISYMLRLKYVAIIRLTAEIKGLQPQPGRDVPNTI